MDAVGTYLCFVYYAYAFIFAVIKRISMPNFKATNDFNCPHCNEMLNGATGFNEYDKPKDGDFSVCVFCAEICTYKIDNGIISLIKLQDTDHEFLKSNQAVMQEIEALQLFVKNRPH